MKRIGVAVQCSEDKHVPARISWPDGRSWKINRVIHVCLSCDGEYDGMRYTVLIGKAERYLYWDATGWYVMA